jgi:hypothetical protein
MRVVRVLIYEGPEEWIRSTWARSQRGNGVPWRGKKEVLSTQTVAGELPGWAIHSTVNWSARSIIESWVREEEREAKSEPDTLKLIQELEKEIEDVS